MPNPFHQPVRFFSIISWIDPDTDKSANLWGDSSIPLNEERVHWLGRQFGIGSEEPFKKYTILTQETTFSLN